jgi:aminomethyltransferase
MKHTSLNKTHRAAGATMVPFAGWDMPVSYAGTVSEVEAVRGRTGIFDVSHMGEVRVTGPGAFSFLQSLTTNDLGRIGPNQAQYSLLLNPAGGVIDDIIIYELAHDDFMVVVNAGCKDKDWDWFREHARGGGNVLLNDESDHTALLAVQGPEAVKIVNDLSESKKVGDLDRFALREDNVAGVRCLVARTGYTGEDGCELFCAWDDAPKLWDAVVAANVAPAGLGARDVLRLEAAYPLYGHELLADVSPLESGAGWAVKPKKGDFIGRTSVLEKKNAGVDRKLVGIRMTERAIPRDGYLVCSADNGSTIGQITSGTYSPTVKAGIALARVDVAQAAPGTEVVVDIRGRRAPATVVELPFYRNGV